VFHHTVLPKSHNRSNIPNPGTFYHFLDSSYIAYYYRIIYDEDMKNGKSKGYHENTIPKTFPDKGLLIDQVFYRHSYNLQKDHMLGLRQYQQGKQWGTSRNLWEQPAPVRLPQGQIQEYQNRKPHHKPRQNILIKQPSLPTYNNPLNRQPKLVTPLQPVPCKSPHGLYHRRVVSRQDSYVFLVEAP